MKFKSIYLIFFILCFACEQKPTVLKSSTVLKDVAPALFINGTQTDIQFENNVIINYENIFNRLPNSEFSMFYLRKHTEDYMNYFNVRININNDKKITIDGTSFSQSELVNEIIEYISFASNGKPTMMHLNFDENLTFEDFYIIYNTLQPILHKDLLFNTNLFIYNPKLLPDCDCEL